MNRNANSHFAVNQTNINIPRSTSWRNQDILTTMNFGDLVPFYVDEILPGETCSLDTSVVARLSTPIHPTMGNAFLDIYYFFCPTRLVWEHWTDFMGENNVGPWTPTVEYSIPQVLSGINGFPKGSIADYFGLPTDKGNLSINAIPFRMYSLIWNQYFRSEAINDFAYLPKGDATVNIDDYSDLDANGNAFCGLNPLPVAKYFDYFTGALPEPQRGEASALPISFPEIVANGPLTVDAYSRNGSVINQFPDTKLNLFSNDGSASTRYGVLGAYGDLYPANSSANASGAGNEVLYNSGLGLSEQQVSLTINELRLAFQLQRLLERDARGGGRYTSILNSHFSVQSPDARLQRAEYLGGKRIPINITQVLQTSATDDVSPQGNTAAYSFTSDYSSSFTKSFVEHGFLIGVCCLRTEHSYQQGIERMWSRKGRYDFYWPVLAHIGEQPILNKEIYAQGTSEDDEVFGYQEAWAEYRYKPNKICGAFRSNYAQSLDVWHYGDYYTSLPTLSPEWLKETKVNVDRTLAVSSELEDQCILNYFVKNKCVLPMPLYSTPGLIDHF